MGSKLGPSGPQEGPPRPAELSHAPCQRVSLSPSQVLQKLGKTVETKDEQFEQSAYNFQLQQVAPGSRGDLGGGTGTGPPHAVPMPTAS